MIHKVNSICNCPNSVQFCLKFALKKKFKVTRGRDFEKFQKLLLKKKIKRGRGRGDVKF